MWRLSIRCFTSPPGDAEAIGQAFQRGGNTLLSRVKIAFDYSGTADIIQNTNFVKGYEPLDNKPL